MPRPDPWAVLAAAGGALGAGLRVRQLLVDRSLWVDEALLADNVLERGYAELLDPLSGQQGAPIGFLWVAKATTSVAGVQERWMRAPSLLAGVALLPLVWLLARRLASARTAALATCLVAVTPGLVRYSAEFKQYATDATVTVALLLLAERAARRRRRPDLVVLAVAGVVAVWLSHAAVLVLPATGLLLLAGALRRRDHGAARALVAVGSLWGASVALLWWVSLRDLTSNEFLTGYWQAGFPDDLGPGALGWAWDSAVDLFDGLGGQAVPALAVVAAVVGAVVLAWARGPWSAALLVAPLPGLLVAAGLEQYPFRGRLALFLLPTLLVAVAGIAELRRPALRPLAVGVVGLLGVAPAVEAVGEAVDPTPFPESRPVLEAVAARRRPGEPIVVHGLAEAPFAVYGDELGLEAAGRTSWGPPAGCAPWPPALRRGPVWVVFAYTHSAAPWDEAAILRSHLDAIGARLDVVTAHDAFAGRWDLAGPPTEPGGARVTAATPCLELSPAGR